MILIFLVSLNYNNTKTAISVFTMNYDKNKYFSSPSKKEAIQNYRQAGKKMFIVGSGSPKHKRNHPPSFARQDFFVKDLNQYQLCPHTNQLQENLAFQMNPKLFTLIHQAISSADKVAKQILRYEYPNLQLFCSSYFLSKQKLYSYIHGESMFQDHHYKDKTTKHKNRKQSSSDEPTQLVSLNQLERLENIVYSKVIPLLKMELDSERKKMMKKKKHKEQSNTQLQQGLSLLQKLNDTKDKLGLQECIQVLQKFIMKSINRQQKLSSKITKLQERYEREIEEKEHIITQLRRKEQISLKSVGDMEKHMRLVDKYQQFVNELKGVLGQKQKSGSSIEGKDKFKQLLKRIKSIINSQQHIKKERRCQHKQQKSQKETHSHCRQEQARHQEQAAKLKEIIKKLTNEIEQLKVESQELEERLAKNSQKLNKLQNKSKKIIAENQLYNENIDKLNENLKNKSNEVQEFSEIINKLEQAIRIHQEDYKCLQQENEKQLQLINKKEDQNEKLMNHIFEIQQKNKQLEQFQQKKQKQIQEITKLLYLKQFEIKEMNNILEKYGAEINQLNLHLGQKNQIIALLQRNNNETRQYYEQKIKEHQLKNLPLWQKSLNYQIEPKESAAVSRERYAQQPLRKEQQRQPQEAHQKQLLGNIYTKQYTQKQDNKSDNPQAILTTKQQKQDKNLQKQQINEHLIQKFLMLEAKIKEDSIDNNQYDNPFQNRKHQEAVRSDDKQLESEKRVLNDQVQASQIEMFKNIAKSQSGKQKTVIIIYQNISEGQVIQNKDIEPLKPHTLQDEIKQIESDKLIQQIKQPQFHLANHPLAEPIDNQFIDTIEPTHNRPDFIPGIKKQTFKPSNKQEIALPIDNQFIGKEPPTPNRPDFIPENINKIPPQLQSKPNQSENAKQDQFAKPIDNQFIQKLPPTPSRPNFIPENINVVPPQDTKKQQNPSAVPIDNQFIQKIPPTPSRPDFIPTEENITKNQQQIVNNVMDPSKQVHNIITEKIQEKETFRPQHITKAEQPIQKQGSNFMGLDSDKDKKSGQKQAQLIKIQDNQLKNPLQPQQENNYLINIDSVEQNKELQDFYIFPELEQHYKIKQLIQINNNIKKYSSSIPEKLHLQQTQFNQLNKQIQKMDTLLQNYKKATINKLAKYNKVNRKIDYDQNSPKDMLQVNNIKKQLISNIRSDSQASVFTIPEHLQELMKQRSQFHQNRIEAILSHEQYAKTTTGIQTQNFRLKRKQHLMESDVMRYFPEVQQSIQKQYLQPQQELDQSFIDDLDSINAIDPIILNSHRIQRIKSMLSQFDPLLISLNLENIIPQEKISEEDLKKSRIRLENSVRQIGNLIQYHRNQILHLHNLFKRTVSIPKIANSQPIPHTPAKRPLQNEQYLAQIMAAPQKIPNEDSPGRQLFKQSQIKNVDLRGERVFQHEFQNKKIQSNAQNENLNTIINKLRENGQVSNTQYERRNSDQNNNEYDKLRAEFLQLQAVNQHLKNQINKLNLIIKQTQHAGQQQLNRRKQQAVITSFRYDDSQKLDISQIKPLQINGNLLLESKQFGLKSKGIRQNNNIPNHHQNTHELQLIQQVNNFEQKSKATDQVISKSNIIPQIEKIDAINQENKRHQSKTQKFTKQGQQDKKAEPKIRLGFGWQELMPQYFTKNSNGKNRNPNKK